MKIALVAGTRPEVIKMLPVYKELKQRSGVTPLLILTGQHRELARDALRMFAVNPDIDMDVMQHGQSLSVLARNLAAACSDYVASSPPDAMLVQGDTTSAMMAGLFAFYGNIPLGHVEAGLRTGNLYAPFPEEFNRRVLTLAARWQFAPTASAAENLYREGVKNHVHVVGNTAVDAVLLIANRETAAIRALQQRFAFLNAPQKCTVLVTAHRRENFGDGIRAIATAINALALAQPQLHFIIPAHPNPNVRPVFDSMLASCDNVHITDPFAYDEVLFLMQKSLIILTDSGGIQEEAPAFDVPVLVMRNETERPEGIAAGCSRLVGTDPQVIQRTFLDLMNNQAEYQRMALAKNPYGDGHAAARIADIMLQSA